MRQSSGLPCVSVIIPCFNQGRFLRNAIESVLAQDYPRFEIIVVNDGSTDETVSVASRFEVVKLINQRNRGVAAARNVGAKGSRGDFLCFVDADDRLLPCSLAVGVQHLQARPSCAVAFGHCRLITCEGESMPTLDAPGFGTYQYSDVLRNCPIWTPSVAMQRRHAFQDAGGFDPAFGVCEDYELYLRLARRAELYCHGTVVAEYRRHPQARSLNLRRMLRTGVRVFGIEKQHVVGDDELTAAWDDGVDLWRRLYGGQLADEFRCSLWTRGWPELVADLGALLRFYPTGLWRIANGSRRYP